MPCWIAAINCVALYNYCLWLRGTLGWSGVSRLWKPHAVFKTMVSRLCMKSLANLSSLGKSSKERGLEMAERGFS